MAWNQQSELVYGLCRDGADANCYQASVLVGMLILWGFNGLCFVLIMVANNHAVQKPTATALGSIAAGAEGTVADAEDFEVVNIIENCLGCR